jgi:hypothetical protein
MGLRGLRRLAALAVALWLLAALPAAGQAQGPPPRAFVATARLSGAAEVPPVDTRTRGVAVFRLSRDGQALEYDLTAAPVVNPTAGHIHVGATGVNGPVVVHLVNLTQPGGCRRTAASLRCSGTITAASLVGPLAGATTLEPLRAAMAAGTTYVNVHTAANPGGEARGQISVVANIGG